MHDKFRTSLIRNHPSSLALYPGTVERELFLEARNSRAHGYTCIMNIQSNYFKGKMIWDWKEFSRGKKECRLWLPIEKLRKSSPVFGLRLIPLPSCSIFLTSRSKYYYIWQKTARILSSCSLSFTQACTEPRKGLTNMIVTGLFKDRSAGPVSTWLRPVGAQRFKEYCLVETSSRSDFSLPRSCSVTLDELGPPGASVTLEAEQAQKCWLTSGGAERDSERGPALSQESKLNWVVLILD